MIFRFIIFLSALGVGLISCSDRQREWTKNQEVEHKINVGMTLAEVISHLGNPSDIVVLNDNGNRDYTEYAGQPVQDGTLMFSYPDQPNKGFSIELLSGRVVSLKEYLEELERRIKRSEQVEAPKP